MEAEGIGWIRIFPVSLKLYRFHWTPCSSIHRLGSRSLWRLLYQQGSEPTRLLNLFNVFYHLISDSIGPYKRPFLSDSSHRPDRRSIQSIDSLWLLSLMCFLGLWLCVEVLGSGATAILWNGLKGIGSGIRGRSWGRLSLNSFRSVWRSCENWSNV